MYKKPSFAHELTECSKKMTKKTYVFAIKVQKLTDSLAYIKYIKEEIILNTLFTNKLI